MTFQKCNDCGENFTSNTIEHYCPKCVIKPNRICIVCGNEIAKGIEILKRDSDNKDICGACYKKQNVCVTCGKELGPLIECFIVEPNAKEKYCEEHIEAAQEEYARSCKGCVYYFNKEECSFNPPLVFVITQNEYKTVSHEYPKPRARCYNYYNEVK